MKGKLLVGALLGAALIWLLNQGYVKWKISQRQPSKEIQGSNGYKPGGVFERTAYIIWNTDADEFFYAIAVGHVDFEPIMPQFAYQYSYSMEDGGRLIVNGTPIRYSNEKRILALNPFGEMQEIALSESEAQVFDSDSKSIWESVVVPRLYQFRGQSENGRRVGTWTCLDMDGRRAYEGDYIDGKRDGKWTYFYPSGGIRAIIYYQRGERHGKWTYFTEDGAEKSVLTWNKNTPVERAVGQAGLDYEEVRYPNGNSEGRHW